MFTGADNSCIQCTGCAMLSFRTYGLLNVLILLCKYSDLVIQCDHMAHVTLCVNHSGLIP